jgi:hypothetical protein
MIAVIHGLSSTKTSPEFLLLKIKAWFEEYVHRYESNAAAFQGNIDLKAEHTRRVCEIIRDIDHISTPVYNALMDGRLVQMSELKTLQDFKLLQIGWIYDVYFPEPSRSCGKTNI